MGNDQAMNDPGYKRLFSRPAMIRDLLSGFAARGWSDTLDFASLNALPASYVSRALHQRHSDQRLGRRVAAPADAHRGVARAADETQGGTQDAG